MRHVESSYAAARPPRLTFVCRASSGEAPVDKRTVMFAPAFGTANSNTPKTSPGTFFIRFVSPQMKSDCLRSDFRTIAGSKTRICSSASCSGEPHRMARETGRRL